MVSSTAAIERAETATRSREAVRTASVTESTSVLRAMRPSLPHPGGPLVRHDLTVSYETIVAQLVHGDKRTRPVKSRLGQRPVRTGGLRTVATRPWAANPP